MTAFLSQVFRLIRSAPAPRSSTRFAALLAAATLIAWLPCAARGATIAVSSTSAAQAIPESNLAGITSNLIGPSLILTDLNLVINRLVHTSVSDLHIELRAPSGLRIVLIDAFTESGLLIHKGTPDDFIGTIFDDQAPTNLAQAKGPYTGTFNINHKSVGNSPLSQFNGLNASGTWTLYVSDRAAKDTGTLYDWSLQFSGTPVQPTNEVPEPGTIFLIGSGIAALTFRSRGRKG